MFMTHRAKRERELFAIRDCLFRHIRRGKWLYDVHSVKRVNDAWAPVQEQERLEASQGKQQASVNILRPVQSAWAVLDSTARFLGKTRFNAERDLEHKETCSDAIPAFAMCIAHVP